MRAAAKVGAFPVLHLGYDHAEAESALRELESMTEPYGVCIAGDALRDISLPDKVRSIILPWGLKPPKNKKAEIVRQVTTPEEAFEAIAAKTKTLIIKGSEGAGRCGEESSFILFQKIFGACRDAGVRLYLQGGVGVHTAAAYIALGAAGVVLDSQVALFPECGLPGEYKSALGRLSGNEIRVHEGYRYYISPGANEISEGCDPQSRIGAALNDVLPLGQDIVLAQELADGYKRLKLLVRAIENAPAAHVKQANRADAFSKGGAAAQALGTDYPIAQGPMARISDAPDFLRSVADGGALPFLAMSMMVGETAADTLRRAAEAMGDKPWGVGVLGFTYPKTFEEQTKIIIEQKPPFVLIAGGRPAQAKPFEREGIKVLLHAPTPGLLDMFLKEGADKFVFEGRESGGHVGPLFSAVLWERQISRILKMEKPSNLCVFFAGGIHDEFSAAFVRIAAGPLTARGVKVCLLCGTAYLYTDEAVRHGAISGTYQKILIDNNRTLLLKSGGGQETRCVPSPFTDYFLDEKARLEEEGIESGGIILKLEALNLGRLRIASKGLERVGDKLVPLPEDEQLEKGLYMTGAVTSLIGGRTAIAELHESLTGGSYRLLSGLALPEPEPARAAQTSVAVIGMAGIFPQAADLDEFWRNIVFGRDCITEVPNERWSTEIFYDPDAKDTDHVVSKWGGFIDKTDFDALEFGITPQSLAAIEPVQLLSLLVAKRALEDAGFNDLTTADLDDTSVIFGAEGAGELATSYGSRAGFTQFLGELPKEADEFLPRLTEDSFPGVLGNVIAGRISNRLNTGGRNFTVDAACASSLAALDIAMAELDSKRAGMVILGGADLHNGIYDYLMFSSTHALSRKGRCATFDSEADGIVLGEGIGALILKRLDDAVRDGDKIYAVIKGTGGSSDGKNLGLTAPSKLGQMRALERAYENAGVKPSDIGLIESHGTGTVVGDQIELSALSDIFYEDGVLPGETALGSVKSLVGHTKCAAGIAGLIKAIDCVRHGVLPPLLHLNKPNAVYDNSSPFSFRTEKAAYWHGDRRIAGVSGFGFGGTNYHAVVENYDSARPATVLKAWPAELFIFPGESADEAGKLMAKVIELYGINNSLRLRDVAYSLSLKTGPIQYAIVAESWGGLIESIDKTLKGTADKNVCPLKAVPGKVAFLFPGQGSQRINMAADIFTAFPEMRRLLNAHPEYERILFPQAVFTDEEKKEQRRVITDTRNAQPLLGIVDLAVAELLRSLGIEPDMAAGHSYGELPALCFAGVFRAEDLPGLSRARAEAILAAVKDDPGRMAAVLTDAETLSGLLEGQENVWAVNFNAPRQIAVAATGAGMDGFLEKAKEAGVSCSELNVACAFHSPLLKGADEGFAVALKDVGFSDMKLPVRSNTDAGEYPAEPGAIKERLAAHLVNPVRFTEEIAKMSEDGAAVFIEAGPGGTLTKLAAEILKGKETAMIQIERSGADGFTSFLQGLAKYIATGRMINMEKLYEGRDAKILNIDEPMQHKKSGIVWNIDGQSAVPENGELPAYAGKPVAGPVALTDRFRSNPSNVNVEHVVLSYLDNMNAMIQDQRDVMLGYLGAAEIAPRPAAARRQFVVADARAMQDTEARPAEATLLPADTDEGDAGGDGLLEISSLTSEQIAGIVFEIVSDKTGYPVSMLNLDMDLEADLSIDSIKKMEIVGELRNRIRLAENEDSMDSFFEKMISIKKFKDMTAWIEELGRSAADDGSPDSESAGFAGVGIAADISDIKQMQAAAAAGDDADAAEGRSGGANSKTNGIIRVLLEEISRPIADKGIRLVSGKSYAVTDDGNGLALKVAEMLGSMGAAADVLGYDQSVSTDAGFGDYDGLILINSSAGSNKYTIMDLFNMLKRVDINRLHWLLIFDDGLGAALEDSSCISGKDGCPELPHGFSGFIKTLCHEYPDKRMCVIKFESAIDGDAFADIVADELNTAETIPYLYYRNGERFTQYPKIRPLESGGGEAPQAILGKDDVVLVLGGAQGITSPITERFAQDYPCQYILIGRTPEEAENEKFAEFASVEDIRKYLIEHEGMNKPKEIEALSRRLFKSSRIGLAKASIEKAGGKAEYLSVDVTDAEAFKVALGQIKAKYGKIDGVIHAAGILEDKLFRYKTADSFMRVYDTKTKPLNTVISELLPELKLLVLFSSMSATFGTGGQSDYSAGNSALDDAARILSHHNPKMKIAAFNWGPWKGAGMVSDGIENQFRRRGVSLIELDEGIEFFANELKYGDQTSVIVLAGDESSAGEFIDSIFK
ncbi:MAG: SDR family NAD(P)-dependent oxidoreductase [Oscillospiraceae bacterium]|jgi:acyl transferase domain-containing protein/NAD(P)-dependent dehydrogenase (short-subunit alcohol dehydrogenase family)|nr:SDR family NAD(P)-dependent oxidoreductase [Oscillospiraceae bacterium]